MNKPKLEYNHAHKQWMYTNGCVTKFFDNIEVALRKMSEFEEHPERHTRHWSATGECLGVDVPYDAWEEPEETFHVGQVLKDYHSDLYMIVFMDGSGSAVSHRGIIRILSLSSARIYEGAPPVKDYKNITREELNETAITFPVNKLTPLGDLKDLIAHLPKPE